jgi:hypothetical protein
VELPAFQLGRDLAAESSQYLLHDGFEGQPGSSEI